MTSKATIERIHLGLLLALFILLRFPALLHQAGGQDEQFFAVPGLTVWNEGIPRIPYLPSRNRASFFEGADRCLMALPPALYYVQAPFFSIFPPTYWPARLPSFLGALLLLVLVYEFARRIGVSHLTAILGILILVLSRQLMFTSIIARPDLLCALCGCAAWMISVRNAESRSIWRTITVGGLCGLAALFHPFALVFCIQAGIGSLAQSGTLVQRIGRAVVLTLAAVAVMALWIPLIAMYPSEFTSQFFSNVLDRAGPGLLQRLLWPWPYLRHHAVELWNLVRPFQFFLMGIGLAWGSISLLRQPRDQVTYGLLIYAWSSVYLTATVAGIHPILGYWLYPTVLIVLVFALALTRLGVRRMQTGLISVLILACLFPGSGLRSSWMYLRHFGATDYFAQKFIQRTLESLPREGLYVVDQSYVLDVYASGRDTLLCAERELYFEDRPIQPAFVLIGWEGTYAEAARDYGVEEFQKLGDPTNPQACALTIFKPHTTQP